MKLLCTITAGLLMGVLMQSHAQGRTVYEQATFAGGCFWCMTPVFEQLAGVIIVEAGYTDGTKTSPTYDEVSSGKTGHVEAIRVTFDPAKINYSDILAIYWQNIDPTDVGGQFVDRGSQYRTVIFYRDADQQRQAEKSKTALAASGRFQKPIVTAILPASPFYKAEEYHQDYYKKNPEQYHAYKSGTGREQFLEKTWGRDVPQQCQFQGDQKKKLTPLQSLVTQKGGTEEPFNNAYWDNHREGIYVDVVSGEVLFSSKDKFDSGSGWPSFTKPINTDNVVEKIDSGHGMRRTEVRSKTGDSHLGHVFSDGPGPDGLRYCINSAALRFIPKEDLVKEGYGKYLKLFK